MNASKAYSLGFSGQNVAVGVMDSGALLQKHPELAGNRFHASSAQGKYGSTGNRYQTGVRGIGDVFKTVITRRANPLIWTATLLPKRTTLTGRT